MVLWWEADMNENNSGMLGAIQGFGKLYGIIILFPMILLGVFYFSPVVNLTFFVLHAAETPEQSQIVAQGYEYYSQRSSLPDYRTKMRHLQERYNETVSSGRKDEGFEGGWISPLLEKIDNGTALSVVAVMLLYLLALVVGLFLLYCLLWAVVQFLKFVRANILVRLAWITTCIINIIAVLNAMPSDTSITFMASHIDFLKILGLVFDTIFIVFAVFVAIRQRSTAA